MDMVPSSTLQVDIFVTNVVSKNVPPSLATHSIRGEGNTLVPPTPHFAQPENKRHSYASDISVDSTVSSSTFADVSYMNASRTESGTGNDVMDIVDMYGDLGHEEHELDFTNFDGEDDTRLPGETQLSYTLRKEGKLRRAKTRRNQNATLHKLEVEHRTNETCSSFQPQQLEGVLTPIIDHSGSRPMLSPRNFDQSSNSEAIHGPFTDEYLSPRSPGSNFTSPVTPHAHSPQSFLYPDHGDVSRDSSKPEAFLPHDSKRRQKVHTFRRPTTFEMDEAEAEDMPIVAERARPGKAKIDRIVAHEANRSRGAMVVACKLYFRKK